MDFSAKTSQYLSFLPAAGRSALTAEKLEEFVAPKIAQEKGSKPEIYLEYGGLHSDIKKYVENEDLRRTVMGFHSSFNYFPNTSNDMDRVTEYRFENFEEGPVNFYEDEERGLEMEYQQIVYNLEGISEERFW